MSGGVLTKADIDIIWNNAGLFTEMPDYTEGNERLDKYGAKMTKSVFGNRGAADGWDIENGEAVHINNIGISEGFTKYLGGKNTKI